MKKLAFVAALVATTSLTSAAHAATMFTDLAAWQAAAGTYSRDSDYGAEYATIATVDLNGGAQIGINVPTQIRNIGSSWNTWSGGYTGQVLFANLDNLGVLISAVNGFG